MGIYFEEQFGICLSWLVWSHLFVSYVLFIGAVFLICKYICSVFFGLCGFVLVVVVFVFYYVFVWFCILFLFCFVLWWCHSFVYTCGFVLVCSCIAYVIAFWSLSSHSEDIVEFYCEVEVRISIFFESFENFKKIFIFH